MKKLVVVMILAALFMIGCGEDGENGVMGLTGPSGLDNLLNPDTQTEAQKTKINDLHTAHDDTHGVHTVHTDFDPSTLCADATHTVVLTENNGVITFTCS